MEKKEKYDNSKLKGLIEKVNTLMVENARLKEECTTRKTREEKLRMLLGSKELKPAEI